MEKETKKEKVRKMNSLDAFLDANVIADWILISKFLIEKKNKSDTLERLKQPSTSYNLVEVIIHKYHKHIHFGTSNLALREAIYVVYENYKLSKLYKKGIPFKFWNRYVQKENISDSEASEIRKRILSVIDVLFDKIALYDDSLNLDVFTFLVLKLGIKTHDSILLSTAIINNFYYFVTRDERLCSKRPRDILLKKFDLKVVSPSSYIRKIEELKIEKANNKI